MKVTGNLALALVAVVLLAVGAVGFADKAEELAGQKSPATEQEHQMDDGSKMEGMDHNTAPEPPAQTPPAPSSGGTDQSDEESDMGGMEGMGH